MPDLVQPINWLAIAPPLAVALTAVAVLVVDAVARGRRPGLVSWAAFGGLVSALALLLPLRHVAGTSSAMLAAEAASSPGQNIDFAILGHDFAFCAQVVAFRVDPLSGPMTCSYVVDNTTLVFQLLAAGGAAVVVLLSTRASLGSRIPVGEYHFLLLCSASGAMVLAGARDLITLVVALELVSLPAFALVGLRGGDRRAAEAALKFFLVSVVSVAVMLFGVSLVYGVTGTVYLAGIDAALRDGAGPAGVAAVGVMLTLVGLAFKVAAVPFHFWVPDTYVGAPVPVAAYLSVVSKAAGFVGLLLVVSIAFPSYAGVWAPVVAVLAALTMTLGNLVALRQRNAVRLLAWSSVAQAGYLLVPLGAASAASSAVTSGGEGSAAGADGLLQATVAYLLIYAVVNLGAFSVVAVTAGGRGSDARGSAGGRPAGGGRMLADYRGMAWSRPLRACALAFFLLALAGLPPGVIGLFGKVVIFRAAIDGGAGWLAVVMAVNVVIALAYYLYWAALLFLPPQARGRPVDGVRLDPAMAGRRLATPWPAGIAVGLTAVLGVVLSVAPNLVLGVLDVVRLAF
ncbi:NADH-quinone oxidoreductase subunit N [Actinopolymorpha sp. B9G3]|uniref:NADH-quinone oxidoreductase subunit N n=1 Tax=Actinopolymorpha sp. B9G3 TaxID=3158970 RepID=UPI0032D9475C